MRLLILLAILTTSAQSIISPPPPPPPPGLPCTHAQALIQAQSIGRIINKPNNNHKIEDVSGGTLEAAASNTQSQTIAANYQHGSSEQSFANQQYNINIPPPPPPPSLSLQRPPQYLSPGPPPPLQNFGLSPVEVQQPPQLPAQLFKPAFIPPGKIVPTQHIGSQNNGHSTSLNRPPPPPPSAHYSSFANSNSASQQFNSGYQYASNYGAQSLSSHNSLHQPSFHQSAPLSGSHGFNSNQNAESYAGAYNHNSHGAHIENHGFIPSTSYSGSLNLAGNSALSGQLGQVIQETYDHAPLDPTIEKHIYVHVPPEDLEDDSAKHVIQHALPVQTRKHYKIIFIKAPSASPNYAQLAAAAAPQTEEKTLVYVLVKKPDEPSIEELQQVQQQAIKSSKPEVYFIKYKTRKEGEPESINHSNSFTSSGQSLNQFSQASGIDAAVDHSSDGFDSIDIRSGTGESGLTSSSSTSYSTSSSTSSASSASLQYNGHSAYGVPLN